MMAEENVDYTLNNPDTLTKYQEAGRISKNVLAQILSLCVEGAAFVDICEKGDELIENEISKVYKGKKISKGFGHPATVSPNSYITPYTPLKSDTEESSMVLAKDEVVKVQLGTQIDGFGTILCESVIISAPQDAIITGRQADLFLATHYAHELLLRLMLPPSVLVAETEEENKRRSAVKQYTQARMNQLLDKVVKSFDCNLVESTTCWLFDRNEIEGKKKIILSPGDGVKGEGLPEVGEVWGVEIGVSLGSGKTKIVPNRRATLLRRTTSNYALKRLSSRMILSEAVKKSGTFPFSIRQLEHEREAKLGIVECVRANLLRQYEVIEDKDSSSVARVFTTCAITKNGITRLAGPKPFEVDKYSSENKITDAEILKLLSEPIAKPKSVKTKKKRRRKPASKKTTLTDSAQRADSDEDGGDEEDNHSDDD